MTALRFIVMPTAEARHFQAGGADAYDLKPERRTSDGDGVPCRHCLEDVAAGEDYLVLAYPAVSHAAALCRDWADLSARRALRALRMPVPFRRCWPGARRT